MTDNRIQLSGAFSEGYGIVPKKILKSKDISSNCKLILCYLLSYTGAGLTCFPSIDTISNDLNLGKRTVIRCLKEAREQHMIDVEQRHLGQGKGKQNIYELLCMHDWIGNASAKNARAKNAGANSNMKNEFAGANKYKKTTLQVTPGHRNINNDLNNEHNININNISSEASQPHEQPVWSYLNCVGNVKEYHLSQNFFNILKTAYPDIDIIQQLHRMTSWLESKSSNRKTSKGMPSFIDRWLSRTYDNKFNKQTMNKDFKSQQLENNMKEVYEYAYGTQGDTNV